MAGGVNKVILIGHLGADPELKYTPSGAAVCEFRIATTESWKDKNGQRQDRTEWHRIVVWGKTAEVCGKYLAKGRQVYLEGRLQTRSWEKDGQKHWTTEIVANDVQFLSSGRDGGGAGGGAGGGGGGRRGGDEGPPPPDDFGSGSGGGGGGGGFGGGGPDDDIPF